MTEIYGRLDKAGVFNIALLVLAFILIYQIGKALIKKFKVDFSSGQEEITFSFGLGLGVITYATFFLGIVGLLYHWIFRLLILCIAIFFIKDILASIKRIALNRIGLRRPAGVRERFLHYVTELKKQLKPQLLSGPSVFKLALALVLLFYIFIYLIAALAPETETDALHYHLGPLRLYLANHRIIPVPTNYLSNYPYAMEMLFLFGCLIKDVYLAKLFHFLSGVLVVFSMYSFCKRYFRPEIGLLAGVLFYAVPLVGYLSKTAYVELGQAHMTFLAIYAALNWYFTEEVGWLYLAGIFSGLALSTKYTGINCLIVILPILFYKVWRGGFAVLKLRSLIGKSFILFFIAFSILSPWSIKSYSFTHNPASPFLNKIFPNSWMSPELEEDFIEATRLPQCLGRAGLGNYLKVMWKASVRNNCGELIGPLFLLFMPLILFFKRFDVATRWLIFIGWFLSLLWVLEQATVFRYLIPTLPFMSIAISVALYDLKQNSPFLRRPVSFFINVFILTVLILQTPLLLPSWNKKWLLALREIPFPVVLGNESRESYLSKNVECYEAFQYINQNLPQDARILTFNSTYQFLTDRILIDFNFSQMGRDLEDLLYIGQSTGPFKKVNFNVTSHHGKVRWIKIKRIGLTYPCWSIHDIRVFEKRDVALPGTEGGSAAEISRSQWQATSNHYALRVKYAFDSSLLTRWTVTRPKEDDPYLLLDLGAFYEIENLFYITMEPNWRAGQHRLELSKDNRNWQAVDFETTSEDWPVHGNLFTEALREIKKGGFNYLFFIGYPGDGLDYLREIISRHAKNSELILLFNHNRSFLYEITVD